MTRRTPNNPPGPQKPRSGAPGAGPAAGARVPRKAATLKESEERLRGVLDTTPFPVAVVDLQDDRVLFWSRSALELFGHTAPTAAEWYALAYPDPAYRADVVARWRPQVEAARRSGKTVHAGEYRVSCRDGSVRICELYASFTRDNLIVTFNDITERKRVEAALIESEERFRAIAENTPDHIIIQDRDLRYTFVANPQLGLTRQDMIGRTDADFLQPADAAKLTSIKRTVLAQGKPVAVTESLDSENGEKQYFQGSYIPWLDEHGAAAGLIGYFRNITEFKRAEQALRESEEKFRAAFQTSQDAMYIATLDDGRGLEVNEAFLRMFGYSRDEVLGRPSREIGFFKSYEDRDRYADELRRQGRIVEMELEGLRKDGRTIIASLSGTIIRLAGVPHILGVVRDITERKRAEKSLRDSESRFRVLSDNALAGIYIIQDGRASYVNAALARIFGYQPDELIGADPLVLVQPEDRPRVREIMLPRLRGAVASSRYEFHGRRKDGSPVDVEILGVGTSIDGRPAIIGNLLDVTERKKAEAAIVRSLREKEILLREIYHRTKNNMNVISAMLSLRTASGADESSRRLAREINDRIRAMALVHQKLYESGDLSRIDLADYLRDLAGLIQKTGTPTTVRVSLDFDLDSVPVTIDTAIPLGMAVTELFSNAFKHAFPGRDQGLIRIGLWNRGPEGIELTFSDDGVGPPPGFHFEAVKTLGLKTIFMLIEHQIGGIVAFEGPPGLTCRIQVPLPAAQRPDDPA